jgi:hypothetical protein
LNSSDSRPGQDTDKRTVLVKNVITSVPANLQAFQVKNAICVDPTDTVAVAIIDRLRLPLDPGIGMLMTCAISSAIMSSSIWRMTMRCS